MCQPLFLSNLKTNLITTTTTTTTKKTATAVSVHNYNVAKSDDNNNRKYPRFKIFRFKINFLLYQLFPQNNLIYEPFWFICHICNNIWSVYDNNYHKLEVYFSVIIASNRIPRTELLLIVYSLVNAYRKVL